MASSSITNIFATLAVSCTVFSLLASAVEHKVGTNSEWKIQSYDAWLAGQTFRVGDTLRFNFVSNQHDVVKVTESDYSTCTATAPLENYGLGSPVVVLLNQTGDHYFICGFPGHCSRGMQIKVDVVAASTPPASEGTPTNAAPTPLSQPGGSGARSTAFGACFAAVAGCLFHLCVTFC